MLRSHSLRPVSSALAFAFPLLVFVACAESGNYETVADRPTPDAPGLVELTAVGFTFEGGPDTVPAGWTTVRLNNPSELTHFAWMARYPEGRGIEDHQSELAPVFQEAMNLRNAGNSEAAQAKLGELPEWMADLVSVGGPGLVAGGGESTEVTVYLKPGTYIIECYVKTGGVYHSAPRGEGRHGMVYELIVTGPEPAGGAAGQPPVEPTIDVAISKDGGITRADSATVPAGTHLVAVHFEDQAPHEHFLGHDVHVARIDEDTNLDSLAAWMDWRAPRGLETPAPARFVGGIEELAAGETGYFTVTLEPGTYAFVSEVPEPRAKGMLQTFSVR